MDDATRRFRRKPIAMRNVNPRLRITVAQHPVIETDYVNSLRLHPVKRILFSDDAKGQAIGVGLPTKLFAAANMTWSNQRA
jgi:hypothetical protein